MEICFLGTSSGTPTKTRNVSAIAIIESFSSDWYLVDCGEGTQHQLLHINLSLNKLKGIFITHVHGDHCYGLPGLLASAGMSGRKDDLVIVATNNIRKWVESTQVHTKVYLPFKLDFREPENITGETIGNLELNSTRLSHRVTSFAYSFTEENLKPNLNISKLEKNGIPKGPLWGKLQQGHNVDYNGRRHLSEDYLVRTPSRRKIIIGGDNDTPELLSEECEYCDVLVHEATYAEDMANKALEAGHSYSTRIAKFAQAASVPNLLLTHFSPRYQNEGEGSYTIEKIRAEAENIYKGNLFLASDFDRYSLDREGNLSLIRKQP